jgi:hypothetical protein
VGARAQWLRPHLLPRADQGDRHRKVRALPRLRHPAPGHRPGLHRSDNRAEPGRKSSSTPQGAFK